MGTPLLTARPTWVQSFLSLLFTAKMWRLVINLLVYIIPSTYQYSLVVNAGEEVFTIDGQVYSSSSSLDCLQGVRCSSPEQEWTTCLVLDQEGDGENNGESDDEEGAGWTGRRLTIRWRARGRISAWMFGKLRRRSRKWRKT